MNNFVESLGRLVFGLLVFGFSWIVIGLAFRIMKLLFCIGYGC